MRTELQKLQKENKQLRSEENKQANLELLETAVSQMTDGDYEACITTFESIDTVGFSDDDLAKYNSLKAELYPKAADAYYTKGEKDTASAKKYYNKIISDYPDSNQIGNARNALEGLKE